MVNRRLAVLGVAVAAVAGGLAGAFAVGLEPLPGHGVAPMHRSSLALFGWERHVLDGERWTPRRDDLLAFRFEPTRPAERWTSDGNRDVEIAYFDDTGGRTITLDLGRDACHAAVADLTDSGSLVDSACGGADLIFRWRGRPWDAMQWVAVHYRYGPLVGPWGGSWQRSPGGTGCVITLSDSPVHLRPIRQLGIESSFGEFVFDASFVDAPRGLVEVDPPEDLPHSDDLVWYQPTVDTGASGPLEYSALRAGYLHDHLVAMVITNSTQIALPEPRSQRTGGGYVTETCGLTIAQVDDRMVMVSRELQVRLDLASISH